MAFSNESKLEIVFLTEACVFVFLDISSFVGNLLVCLSIYRNSSLRSITNTFVLSLAVTDLCTAVLVMPFVIEGSTTQQSLGYSKCQYKEYVCYCLGGISMQTMALIAVNRYIRVVKPRLYPRMYTKRSALIMCVSVWVVTLFVAILAYFFVGFRFEEHAQLQCTPNVTNTNNTGFAIAILVVYCVPPSVIITVCYAMVFKKIRSHNHAITPSLQGSNRAVNNSHLEEVKITKTLAAVVAGFYCCWLTYFTASVLLVCGVVEGSVLAYYNLFYRVPVYVSTMINPLIYTISCKAFRNEFRKAICCS